MLVVVLGVLIAFTIENKKDEKQEEEIEQEVVDRNDEKTLPEFETIAIPSIIIWTSEEKTYQFDNSYSEVCWNDCDEWNHYNYPEIHSGDVELGDKLQIAWNSMKPLPDEMNLINVNGENYKEINKEKKDVNLSPLDLTVDEEMIGKQFAIEFLWKDGEMIEGRSIMNFKLK
jgi:hypothetical protein